MNNEKFSLIGVAAEIREGFCMARDMSGEMSLKEYSSQKFFQVMPDL